jgi:hypothetical protein
MGWGGVPVEGVTVLKGFAESTNFIFLRFGFDFEITDEEVDR